jgi:hypothetical protein
VAYINVSAVWASTSDQDEQSDTILVSTDGVNFSYHAVLTFDSATNWDSPQTIYVKAASDDAQEGERKVVISHSILSDNPAFNELPIRNVEVNVLDDDSGGLLFKESGNSTVVLEGDVGAITDAYEVTLASQPSGIVTTMLENDEQISLSDTELTFTPSDWNAPQTVTVNAVDDAIRENTLTSHITHTLESTDPLFSGTESYNVDVNVLDDDAPRVLVSESDGSTLLVQGGSGDEYQIRLAKEPAGDVTIRIHTDGQALVSSTDGRFFDDPNDNELPAVTFSADDWFTPVTIQVTADEDYQPDPAELYVKKFPIQDHVTNQIQGPILFEGGVGEDRSLREAVMLPTEQTAPPLGVVVNVDESQQTDTLNVYNDSSVSDDSGLLSFNEDITHPGYTLSGLDMGVDLTVNEGTDTIPNMVTYSGGITYSAVEILDVLLGTGHDTFEVSHTAAGTITVIQGGGGDDTITVTRNDDLYVPGDLPSPLAIFGDTSQDGSFYDSIPGVASTKAISFDNAGDDIIDASASPLSVTVYGGMGNDTIWGSQAGDHIAGGSGDDSIHGQAGVDHITLGVAMDGVNPTGSLFRIGGLNLLNPAVCQV